jgi:O-6-methylguanine DNA methyltransferase
VLPQTSPQAVIHIIAPANTSSNKTLLPSDDESFGDLPKRITEYLSGKQVTFPDKLDLSGSSPFQRKVWEKEKTIPYGETRTYQWLATALGYPHAARAVGNALAKNPLPILIPCHRVIRSDGNLGGFSGGVQLKRALLQMEARGNQHGSMLARNKAA